MKKYIIAFDLHGTLLDEKWKFSHGTEFELISYIEKFNYIADFYICTGNDFKFVEENISKTMLDYFTGFILESGCLIKKKSINQFLINNETKNMIKELETYFIEKKYPFVKYFAQREATISLFTCDENGGEEPSSFYHTILNDLQKHKFGENFYLTWSNVALDIIPILNSKWNALNHLRKNNKIICFMDSFNDKESVLLSDLSFIPRNASHKLIKYLREKNKLIFPIDKFHLINHHVFISSKSYTMGVIEGLKTLEQNNFFEG